jgi:hypothetical protein
MLQLCHVELLCFRSGSDIYDIQPNDGLLDDMTELLTAKIPEDRLTSSSDDSYIYSDVELNGDDNSEPLVKPSEIKTNDRLHHGKYYKCRILYGIIYALLWCKDLIQTALVCFDSEERTQKEGQELRKRAVNVTRAIEIERLPAYGLFMKT